MVDAEWVREFLDYNPDTGEFFWKKRPSNRVQVGQQAGVVLSQGYHIIGIRRQIYVTARIAWLWMTGEWPSKYVDHINGNRADDRWVNLRLADHAQNLANRGRQRNNTSGFKGVNIHNQSGKWEARITHRGKTTRLGLFTTPEEAYAAYCGANERINGEFSHN